MLKMKLVIVISITSIYDMESQKIETVSNIICLKHIPANAASI